MKPIDPSIRAILWDFGDTLCDERWALAPMDGAPTWATTYRQVLGRDGLVDRWDRGEATTAEATTAEVATAVAKRLGAKPDKIRAHLEACSRNITFYPGVMNLIAQTQLPQAIVTINCDLFSQVVAPTYDLGRKFQTIVTSWQEGCLDKAALCEIAMERLDPALRPGDCLLVDNRPENVAAWIARGGLGHRFAGEAALIAAWLL